MCWDKNSQKDLVPSPEWRHGFKIATVSYRKPTTYGNQHIMPLRFCSWKSYQVGVVMSAAKFGNDSDSIANPGFGFQIFTTFDAAIHFCTIYGWNHRRDTVIADVWYRYADKTADARDEYSPGYEVYGTCIAAQEMIVMPGLRKIRDLIGG